MALRQKKTAKAVDTLANETLAAQPTTKRSERKIFKNGQNANGEFVANVLVDLADSSSTWWTGRYNHDIFSMSKSDDTEFRQFHQEIEKRTKDMDDYGESDQPTIEDSFTVRDGKGNEYIYVVKLDGYLHGVVVAKINKAKYNSYVNKYGGSNNHGRAPANTIRRVGRTRANLGRKGSGVRRSERSNGSPGPSGVVGTSPKGKMVGNYEGEGSLDRKVPAVTKKSERDSAGNKLSKQQQEFFIDSVVRDKDGNLLVMYHGTSKGGYTVFDTYGGNHGLFGIGSYFTDNKEIAQTYTQKGRGTSPQVYEAYLDIRNPLDMDAKADPAEWLKAFPDVDFPASGTNEEFYRAVELWCEDEMMYKWDAAETIQAGIESGMGYDGITHIGGGRVDPNGVRHRVYIAFQPEQIKSVDNKNPTTDPDIRYSERGTGTSNRTLLANAFEGLSQNSDEYAMIQEYRNRIRLLEEQDEFVFPDVHKILRNNITSNNITKNISLATSLMWQGNFTFYLVT